MAHVLHRIAGLSLLLALSGSLHAQSSGSDEGQGTARRAAQQAAESALPTLRRAAAGEGAPLLGFRSAEEGAAAVLGEPLPVSVVPLDALKSYVSAQDPAAIVRDAHRMLFPVLSGAQTRSGIEVRERAGTWRTSTIGGARVAQLLDAARAAHRATPGSAGARYFVVQVPALNLYLLGADMPGGRWLIPLADDPRFAELRAGVPIDMAAGLAALVPAARQVDPAQSN